MKPYKHQIWPASALQCSFWPHILSLHPFSATHSHFTHSKSTCTDAYSPTGSPNHPSVAWPTNPRVACQSPTGCLTPSQVLPVGYRFLCSSGNFHYYCTDRVDKLEEEAAGGMFTCSRRLPVAHFPDVASGIACTSSCSIFFFQNLYWTPYNYRSSHCHFFHIATCGDNLVGYPCL